MNATLRVLPPHAQYLVRPVPAIMLWLMISSPLLSQVLWDGGTSGAGSSWNTNTNWAGDVLPASGADITFSSRTGGGLIPSTISASRTTSYGTITFDNINNALPATLTVNTNGSGSTARTVTINSGISLVNSTTTVVFNEATFGVLDIVLGNNITINTQLAGSQITMNPLISGAFRITKTGAGTLRLQTSANTFTGGISVLGGTLSIGADSRFGAVPGAATAGHLLLNSGTLLTTSTYEINANRGIALGPSTGTGTGTFEVNSGLTLTYDGIVADNPGGSGRLLKTGDGSLRLNGSNTYTGGVSIQAGTLSIGSDARLGAVPGSSTPGHLLISGGTLSTTFPMTINSNRGIALGPDAGAGAGTLRVANAGETLTYAGDITNNGSGTGQLIKTGDGILRLTGSSTYSGGTQVLGGTLSFLQGTSMGAAPASPTPGYITVSGGTIEFDNGTGNLTLATNRGIALGPTSGSGTGGISVANSAATLTYAGIIADTVGGTGAMVKSGAGTLRLQGANTYSGGTTVSAGTLMVSNSTGSATGSGDVTVATGGVLRGAGSISGSLTVQSGGELRPGETAVGTINTAAVNVDAGGKLIFRLSGNNTNDRLNAGAALFTLNTAALIEVIYEGAYTALEGHGFNLMDWGSISSDGNLADQISLPALAGGLVWDTTQLTTMGMISVTIVPEPTKVLLMVAGLMLMMLRRRRV